MLPRFVGVLSAGLVLWLLRHRRSIELLHVNFNRSVLLFLVVLVARLSRIPYVLQTHGMCNPWKGPRGYVDQFLTWPMLRASCGVLVLNSEERELLRERAPKAKYFLLPNAVNYGYSVGREYVLESTPLLLFCARLHPRKGVHNFVQVCAELKQRGMSIRGRIAGSDEGARGSAEELAERLGAPVEFLGSLPSDRVRSEMQAATLLLHPAPFEPFGMTMIEAMSVGTVVVAAESSRLAPVFRSYDAAVLASDYDVTDWVRSCIELLSDAQQRKNLAVNAALMIRKEFSPEALAANLAHIRSEAVRHGYRPHSDC